MKINLLFFILFLAAFNLNLTAQNAGDIDTTFNPNDIGFGNGDGFNSYVKTMVLQPDTKAIIGGEFTNYNNTLFSNTPNRIARLNSNGSLDTSFNIGTGFSALVNTLAYQPDGKIIVGGWFSHYNGTLVNRIARLNANGTLDTTFLSGTGLGFNGNVFAVRLQSNGKMIIGGQFSSFDSSSVNRIIRLDTNGIIDTSFNMGSGFNGDVYSIDIQPDGKIIVGGSFTNYNNNSVNRVVRLNLDASIDTSFNIGTGFNNTVEKIKIQPDGRILIGGNFTSYDITSANRIIRLNSNGLVDTSFSIGTGFNNIVYSICIQPDGNILIGGNFTIFNNFSINRFIRLTSNGTRDSTFNIEDGASSRVYAIVYRPDSNILAGGQFTFFDNHFGLKYLVSTNQSGEVNYWFNKGTAVNGTHLWDFAIQPDEKILTVGGFYSYDGIRRNGIARINTNGTLDTTFNPMKGFNGTAATIVLLNNGQIIVGGGFTKYNGTSINRIARINPNGTLDTTFNIGSGFNGGVNIIILQPDGKILVSGGFNTFNGFSRNKIVRLNSDGSIDNTFSVGNGFNFDVWTLDIQFDGKILAGGMFTSYDGVTANRIVRLNSNGSIDLSFNSGVGFDGNVWEIKLQNDGKILIGGSFINYNNVNYQRIVRLNTNGTIDNTFNALTGSYSGNIITIAIQQDNKIIVGGTIMSSFHNRILRLNSDGTLDSTFIAGVGFNNEVYNIDLQTDNKIIVVGRFTAYNQIGRTRIARLNNCVEKFSIDTISVCDSLTWIDNITYTSSTNTPTFILTNAAGCDSVVTLYLTILNSTTGVDTQIACDSLIWIDNVTYSSSTNTPTFTLTNAAGCDSVVTLNLTILNSTTGVDTQIACDSLTWIDNVTYTSSTNTPTFTLTNAAGCDSLVTLNLTILNSITGVDTQIACDSLTWIDGLTYTSSTNTPTFNIVGGAANGCDSLVTLNLTINSLNASYTSIDNGGGNYTFTNTSTGSFTQTHWAFGDGTTSTLANPTHTFNANGTYVVVLTINDSTTNNTCMDYYLDTLVVTGVVNPVPCAAGFVMYPDGNNNVTVVNSSTGNNLTYFWDFGDGDTSTMQFPSHTYATAGPFYLCLTVNDGASCVDTYCDSIGINGVVFNKQTGFTINVIAPPVVVGVDEQGVLATDVTIYPNPTTSEFIVELVGNSSEIQLSIVSIEGKTVYTNNTINTNKINVDAADWSKGVYIVKITSKQSSKVMKLIKQ